MQKEWQEVNNLVEAESEESNAQENIEREQVALGAWDNVGSSGSAGASAAGSEAARNNQDMLLDTLAKEHARDHVKLRPEPNTI